MPRHRLPSFGTLWARHELLYVDVFTLALQTLAAKPSVTGDEDSISESLCPMLTAGCFQIENGCGGEVRVPMWETPRQPVSSHDLAGGKKQKRPDFTCSFHNRYAQCPEDFEIPFHIECKRLGKPTSPGWKLNKNYVTKGIKRFDCKTHEYGKRASSGMMVGYVISMSPKRILAEVNNHIGQFLLNCPAIAFSSSRHRVSTTEQRIVRQNVTPADFRLKHIWTDLRHNYQ